MNKERRKRIREVITELENCSSQLESIKGDEDDARDARPESFQESEGYEHSENCSDTMDNAISDIREVVSDLEEIV